MLDDLLARVQTSDTELVILDLRELEFMDSTGLSVVVKAYQRSKSTGQRLAFVKGPQQVQRLRDLTRIAEKLTLADTPEELFSEPWRPKRPLIPPVEIDPDHNQRRCRGPDSRAGTNANLDTPPASLPLVANPETGPPRRAYSMTRV